MNDHQIQEFFQIGENVIKYGSLRMRLAPNLTQEEGLVKATEGTEEWTSEEKYRFFQRLNTP